MDSITVPDELRARLLTIMTETEIRDESGKLIGRFVPLEYVIPEWNPTEEELAELLSPDAKTYTTEEVLAHAKGLVK